MGTKMKKVFRLAAIVAGLVAAAWLVKDRLLPSPQPPATSAPPFRSPSTTPPRPAPVPAPSPPEPTPTAEVGSPGEDGDDLTEIKGIGPVYAARLAESGIATFTALAAADPSVVAERLNVSDGQARSWIEQAGDHVGR